MNERIILPATAKLRVRVSAVMSASHFAQRKVQHLRYSQVKPKSRISTWLFVAFLCCLCFVVISGCSSTSRKAPVIDRAPAPKAEVKPKPVAEPTDIYTVKKGDTLIGIALDYGLDYKELAAWNDITNPSEIRVGQQLRLAPPGQQVVTAPLKTVPGVAGRPVSETEKKSASEVQAANTALLKVEPKAVVLPYSDETLAQLQRGSAPPKLAKVEGKPQPEAEAASSKSENEDDIDWGWPAVGKVINGFSETNNAKGIDISGKIGQAVIASAPGKVIYSGSGIRGYGQLIIVKHGKNYASVYAHNSQILVKEGQQVVKGQKIAEMGNTDADHVMLHFEIRRLGNPVDPMKYLPQDSNS
jgi:lipoprotein NlpD